MQAAQIEHANFTVTDPDSTADLFCRLFDWQIRWSGESLDHGYTVHVGSEDSYLALYTHAKTSKPDQRSHRFTGNLNHVGIVVDDIDIIESRVIEAGLKTFNHADYDPGKRFYFNLADGIEMEVISYNSN